MTKDGSSYISFKFHAAASGNQFAESLREEYEVAEHIDTIQIQKNGKLVRVNLGAGNLDALEGFAKQYRGTRI